jgi:hypothetical protein
MHIWRLLENGLKHSSNTEFITSTISETAYVIGVTSSCLMHILNKKIGSGFRKLLGDVYIQAH